LEKRGIYTRFGGKIAAIGLFSGKTGEIAA